MATELHLYFFRIKSATHGDLFTYRITFLSTTDSTSLSEKTKMKKKSQLILIEFIEHTQRLYLYFEDIHFVKLILTTE